MRDSLFRITPGFTQVQVAHAPKQSVTQPNVLLQPELQQDVNSKTTTAVTVTNSSGVRVGGIQVTEDGRRRNLGESNQCYFIYIYLNLLMTAATFLIDFCKKHTLHHLLVNPENKRLTFK